MIKIGYQGIPGSNSEDASLNIGKNWFDEEVELVPLVTSKNVVKWLRQKEIDFGVVAYRNNIGGLVKETAEVLEETNLKNLLFSVQNVNHCLYKYSEDINNEEITKIVSHEQAIFQTKDSIERLFPNVDVEAIEDTAIGAYRLANGEIDKTVAVICSKRAGEMHNLTLIEEDIEKTQSKCYNFFIN